MIETDSRELKSSLRAGAIMFDDVARHEARGLFIDIDYQFYGLLQITDFTGHE